MAELNTFVGFVCEIYSLGTSFNCETRRQVKWPGYLATPIPIPHNENLSPWLTLPYTTLLETAFKYRCDMWRSEE